MASYQNKDGGNDTSLSSPSTVDKLSPVVVFAHGAGAPSSSDWMIRWKDMLGKALNAVEVVTFDYPYISGGKRKAPPKAEKLVEFHSDIVKKTVAKYPGHPLILAGKSMGSRVSCMIACNENISASAIVCLGYPLKGMNGALRDQTLLQVTVPIMFVQGSKDTLCPVEKLEAVRKKMKSLIGLHVIDGGDHSFKIAKKHLQTKGSTQDEAEDLAVQAIAAFVSRLIAARYGFSIVEGRGARSNLRNISEIPLMGVVEQRFLWSSAERRCLQLLQQRNTLASIVQIHAFMLRNALETNVNLLTKFITACASLALFASADPLAGIHHARRVFDGPTQMTRVFVIP
ncbi:KAT8 regulatory NSL complex subunit 3 [Morella rubra]|uniref:KAT8 regulatory NSL complex subunit 3 n=1 Tax=Morella rubra TaxID=262757 RepID=A0A6A1VRN9_9ROSI|nr:KAT8 regulatory NSL complex subunit 3 [Morella rubra]